MNQLGVIFKYTNVEKLNRTKTSASSWNVVLFNQFLENEILAAQAFSNEYRNFRCTVQLNFKNIKYLTIKNY